MKKNSISKLKTKVAVASVLIAVLALSTLCPVIEDTYNAVPMAIVLLALLQLLLALAAKQESSIEEEKPVVIAPVEATRSDKTEAELVHLLSQLQEKGRFIDFVMDDITPYSDVQVAAAARVVHQGCQKFVKDNFAVESIASVAEGQSLTLDKGYNAADYRLLGNVAAEPPHAGTLLHRGWKVTDITMSRLTDAAVKDGKLPVIAPAELEIK